MTAAATATADAVCHKTATISKYTKNWLKYDRAVAPLLNSSTMTVRDDIVTLYVEFCWG